MSEPTRSHDPVGPAGVLDDIRRPATTEALREWLPKQRWFAGKGRPIRGVGVESAVEVCRTGTRSGAGIVHLVVWVEHADTGAELPAPVDRYQVLVGVRSRRLERLAHAEIGQIRGGPRDGAVLYDAAHDRELTGWLLERFVHQDTVGPLTFHLAEAPMPGVGAAGLVIGAEQSNTSVVFGDEVIMKLFRRLTPGVNPDLEVCLALSETGSRRVPQPIAWYDMPFGSDGETTTLGMVQEYLRTGTDGWELAKTSVRDLYADSELPAPPGSVTPGGLAAHEMGGDFAGESFRLGVATAEVHADLARTLGTGTAGVDELAALAEAMERRLGTAVQAVPALGPYADRLRAAYSDLVELGRDGHPVPVQRIHGDYHLGQVMRTATRWVLFDFEGEPAAPLAERRALHSPLRDVAAMLRSFDYAARHLLTEPRFSATGPAPHLVRRAEEWASRNREAFCAGYAKAGGVDPRAEPVLLRAFETDKAVYEVAYESGNRPSWVAVPMSAVRRLAERTPQPR